jgi:hypothetical protein
MPHYFYIYNISSDDSAAIQTARAEIYLCTTETPYKIDSRILVLASMGQGIFPSNVPARRHSGYFCFSRKFLETDVCSAPLKTATQSLYVLKG